MAWAGLWGGLGLLLPEKQSFLRYADGDAIDASGLSYREINDEILREP